MLDTNDLIAGNSRRTTLNKVDESQVQSLVATLGLPEDLVREGLRRHHNIPDAAVNWILEQM